MLLPRKEDRAPPRRAGSGLGRVGSPPRVLQVAVASVIISDSGECRAYSVGRSSVGMLRHVVIIRIANSNGGLKDAQRACAVDRATATVPVGDYSSQVADC